MSPLTHRISISPFATCSVAIAALLGTTFLTSPLTAARAESVAARSQLAQATVHSTAAKATNTQTGTVEQRITSLHTALKITPAEETDWNSVAQAMRENAAAMQKVVAEKSTQAPQSMNAVQDMQAYEKLAQTHVDGLKNLISSFDTLYNSMPDPQKKVADQVFQSFGHKGPAPRS
jgi:protein CpxP